MPAYVKPKTKRYVRPVPADWWLKRPAYLRFMIREISSAFLAGYAVFLLVLMAKARDAAAFQAQWEALRSPVSIALHLVVLFFALFHSITFFSLTPRVLVVRRGEEKVADHLIAGAHFVLWFMVSAVILLVALKV